MNGRGWGELAQSHMVQGGELQEPVVQRPQKKVMLGRCPKKNSEKELTVGVIWVFQFFVPHLLQNPEVGVGVYQPDLEKKVQNAQKMCIFWGKNAQKSTESETKGTTITKVQKCPKKIMQKWHQIWGKKYGIMTRILSQS